jgi:hypothetical protein
MIQTVFYRRAEDPRRRLCHDVVQPRDFENPLAMCRTSLHDYSPMGAKFERISNVRRNGVEQPCRAFSIADTRHDKRLIRM